MLLYLAAFLSLLPAALLALIPPPRRAFVLWSLLAVAAAGPTTLVAVLNANGWHPSLSGALWASVVATMLLFALVAALNEAAWRLLPLLAGYGFILGLAGTPF